MNLARNFQVDLHYSSHLPRRPTFVLDFRRNAVNGHRYRHYHRNRGGRDCEFPSTPGGDVAPSHVAYCTTIGPFAAGLAGEFRLPSALRNAPGPWPELLAENRAGALGATGRAIGADVCPS